MESKPDAHRRPKGRPRWNDVLTPAEWRTVHAVQHGMTNREIAARRGISIDAVKYHVTNVLQKLGLSGRHALRKWIGVPRHSALHGRGSNMSEPGLEMGPIGQISRTVADIDAAQRWYRDVLGLPHLYTYGKLAFFDCGGTRLYLQEGEPGPESVIYLRVDDIVTAHAALTSRGVEFETAPHMIFRHDDGMEEWMAFFNDPEGRPLAIMAQVRP
jgi:DNA-binding CsgD family transcriptional regulator/catechol 2,3-dioxygenase-like lactoylglutathione lyase family enzyme